ncbi:hypothetical protein BaRGS_00003937 [Batillaria attramentaria]|uniref:Uncharacterized protein n=1 Tax=Batillaria attramentaria TaxID=370345 RepID=A0ABD0M0S6_9CAEN
MPRHIHRAVPDPLDKVCTAAGTIRSLKLMLIATAAKNAFLDKNFQPEILGRKRKIAVKPGSQSGRPHKANGRWGGGRSPAGRQSGDRWRSCDAGLKWLLVTRRQ